MENVNMAFCLISEKKLYGLFSIKHFGLSPCLTPQRDFVIIAKFIKDKSFKLYLSSFISIFV